MKTFNLLLCLALSSSAIAQKKSVIITGSGGVHSTQAKVMGANPYLLSNSFYSVTPMAGLRIFKTGKTSQGLYLGIVGNADAIKVKTNINGSSHPVATGSSSSEAIVPRFELGYHLMTKKIYFSNLLADGAAAKTGFFTQIQPFAGLTFIRSNYSGAGTSSATNTQTGDYTRLEVISSSGASLGTVYGLNFHFGKGEKTWFFINVAHNINFTRHSSYGLFTSSKNGVVTKNAITTSGSGFTLNAGLVLHKFKYKK